MSSSTPHKKAQSRAATPCKAMAVAKQQQPGADASHTQGVEGIQVAIRMRPLNKTEGDLHRVWKVLPKYSSVAQTTNQGKPLPERVAGRNFFTFDKTFGEDSSTKNVYDSVAKNIVSSVCTGLNGTIFAYGQTSSGKTYTMQGAGTIAEGLNSGGGGIVHMAAQDVFSHIQENPERVFLVRASFLEIYNEEVRDLLSSDNRTLQIREDPRRGVFVQSKEEVVTDFDSLLGVLFTGEKSRAFASTAMNERSSRSHTIFRITLESRKKPAVDEAAAAVPAANQSGEADDDGAVRVSTLNLVDLAGAESVRHTGANGDRQKEGGIINQSLLTLSRVIVALGVPNQTHINFRDSKLTRILQPSLSGNARMAVVCCATPSELYLEETRSTLLFANRAKLVKTNAQVNEVLDDRSIIRRLQRELTEARRLGSAGSSVDIVRALERQAVFAGTAKREAEDKLKRLHESILNNDGSFFAKSSKTAVESRKRQRRLSEGNLLFSDQIASPMARQQTETVPQTDLRPSQPKSAPAAKFLAPSSELELLRQALSARCRNQESLQLQLVEASKVIQSKESDLVAVNCANDLLRKDRDATQEKYAELSQQHAAKLANFEEARIAHTNNLSEKNLALREAQELVEKEAEGRRTAEERAESVQAEYRSLTEKFERAQEECAKEIGSLNIHIDTMAADSKKLSTSVHELRSQNTLGETAIADVKKELDCMREESQEIAVNLAKERDALTTTLATTAEELLESQALVASLSADLLDAQSKGDSALESIRSLNENISKHEQKVEAVSAKSLELETDLSSERREKGLLKKEVEKKTIALSELNSAIIEKDEILSKKSELLKTTSSELQVCEEKLKAAILKYESATEMNGVLEAQHQVIKSEQQSTCDELANMKDELLVVKITLENKENELDASATSLRNIESKLQDCQIELEEEHEHSDDVQGKLDESIARTSEIEKALTVEQKRNSELEAQVTKSTELNRDVEDRLRLVVEKKVALATSHSQLEMQLKDVLAERDNFAASGKELSISIANLEVKNSNLEAQMKSNQEDSNTLIGAQENTIANLEIRINSANESLVNLESKTNNEIAKLTEDRDNLFTELERTTASLSETAAISTNLEETCSKLNVEHKSKDQLIQKIQTEQANLESNLVETKETILRLESQAEDLQQKFTISCDECAEAKTKVAQLVELNNEAQIKIEGLTVVLLEASRDQSSIKADLLTSMNELCVAHDRAVQLEEKHTASILHLNEVTCEHDKIVADKAALFNSVSDAGIKIEGLTTVLQYNEAEIARMAVQIASLTEERDTERSNSTDLQSKLAEIVDERNLAGKEISETNTTVLKLQDKINCMEATIKSSELQKEALSSQIGVLTETVTNAHSQISSFGQMFEEKENHLEGQLSDARSQLSTAQSSVANLAITANQAKENVEHLTTTVATLNEERDSLHKEIKDQKDAAECSMAETKELIRQIEMHQSTIKSLNDKDQTQAEEKADLIAQIEDYREKCKLLNSESATAESREVELTKEKAEAEEKIAILEQQVENMTVRLEETKELSVDCEERETELKDRLCAREEDIENLDAEKVLLEAKLERETENLKGVRDELIRVHEYLETTRAHCKEAKKTINDLEDELESKETIMSQSVAALEKEKLALTVSLEDTAHQLETLKLEKEDLLNRWKERELDEVDSSAQTVIAENTELKVLLVNANKSVEEARETSKLSQAQLDEKIRTIVEFQEQVVYLKKQIDDLSSERERQDPSSISLSTDLQKAFQAKNEATELLERERVEHRKNVNDLKSQMSDERRALIHDAENTMQDLRSQIDQLELATKALEAEAYTARQMKEDLEDQSKNALDRAEKLGKKFNDLESENVRLRRASFRQDCERDAELNVLKSTHQQLKREYHSKTSKLQEAEKKLSVLNEAKVVAENEILSLKETYKNVDTKNSTDATQLRQTVSELENYLGSNKEELEKLQQSHKRANDTINECKQKLGAKDERIKKLEASKMTKAQVQKIMDLKMGNRNLSENLASANEEIRKLKSNVAAGLPIGNASLMEDSALTKLRFDNQALESKLRKFATHCQRLEDEKVGIVQVLRTSKVRDLDTNDLGHAIVTMCDKLVSLEEECDSLTTSGGIKETKALRAKNASLERETAKFESRMNELILSEQKQKENVAVLSLELEAVRQEAHAAQGSSTVKDEERDRQVRYLEQENHQLMVDLKDVKKQLRTTKAEMSMLRTHLASSLETVEVSSHSEAKTARPPRKSSGTKPERTSSNSNSKSVSARKASRTPSHKSTKRTYTGIEKENSSNSNVTSVSDCRTPSRRSTKRKCTGAEKENSSNSISKSVSARESSRTPSSTSTQRPFGLGDAFAATDENTQDCRQS